MHGGISLVGLAVGAVGALTGVLLSRRRNRIRYAQTGGLDRRNDQRWNAFLLALILVPTLIALVLQLVL